MSTEQHIGHGNSVAAWTSVAIMLLGSLVICLAVVNWSQLVAIVGVVILVLGLAAWGILGKMGYGEKH